MNPDFYDRALRRIWILTVAVGVAGAAAVLYVLGFRAAVGFVMGTALSMLNLQGLTSLTQAVVGSKRPGPLAALLIALRYLVIGFALYVIVKILGFTPLAVLAGLLAAFGAVLLEILYELISRIS